MNLYQKISVLGPSAQYDTCGPKDFGLTTDIPGVYHAKVGGNHVCRLFKVLQSNVCKNNCSYCAFRKDRDCNRVSATAEEMARAFDSAYSRRLVEGLFLSSGIVKDADTTMSKMIDTAFLLRRNYAYKGYLHLKIMPGASKGAIEKAALLANRLSLNIESPTQESLSNLSGDKDLKKGFYYTLSLIKQELKRLYFMGKKAPSLTTQFVVGAGEENDKEIIKSTFFLYKNFGLKRVFYSAFRSVERTPLENKTAVSMAREHRLYQADFLMRFYRFFPWQIPLDQAGFLSEVADPKLLWAKQNANCFPINLNLASYWDLLKIPGIGPTSAKKIIELRKGKRINSFDSLRKQRFQIEKLSKFASF